MFVSDLVVEYGEFNSIILNKISLLTTNARSLIIISYVKSRLFEIKGIYFIFSSSSFCFNPLNYKMTVAVILFSIGVFFKGMRCLIFHWVAVNVYHEITII